jgi:signal transduction histidine kinase
MRGLIGHVPGSFLPGLVTLGGLVGLVVAIVAVGLDPPAKDLLALSAFLTASGGVTIGAGIAVRRYGIPFRVRTLRGRMLAVAVAAAGLALANVAFVSSLMFLSAHDLLLLAALLAFSFGLAVFVAHTFADATGRSLIEVMAAARRLSDGDLGARANVVSADEVGDLARAFNGMAERLQAAFARQRDLENTRREVVTAVSHDLRTPLASIRAMVESINDHVVSDPETIAKYLRATQAEVEYMTRLVNDLFELSQMDAGVLGLHLEEASIGEVITRAVEALAPQAEAAQLNLQEAVEGGISPVVMDERRIMRALTNLVQNAIRHTPPDGTVSVRAFDAGDAIQVEVTDTGEGIPESELPKLFQRSYRHDPSRTRKSGGGAGLGLSIARGFVEAHGGRIWAESVVGAGSTFAFTVPKARPQVAHGA